MLDIETGYKTGKSPERPFSGRVKFYRMEYPMKPRITINTTKDGEIEIRLNPPGRDLLVRELLALDERREHFHFNQEEVKASRNAYRPTDTIYEYGKVYFRPEEWDKKHFPHVFEATE